MLRKGLHLDNFIRKCTGRPGKHRYDPEKRSVPGNSRVQIATNTILLKNTEGQCLAWRASQPVWDLLGASGHNNLLIHLDGHAILRSDMEYILDYCDVHLLGAPRESAARDLSHMKGNLFLEDNRNLLDPLFDSYIAK